MTVVGFVSERLLQDIDAFPLNALWVIFIEREIERDKEGKAKRTQYTSQYATY